MGRSAGRGHVQAAPSCHAALSQRYIIANWHKSGTVKAQELAGIMLRCRSARAKHRRIVSVICAAAHSALQGNVVYSPMNLTRRDGCPTTSDTH